MPPVRTAAAKCRQSKAAPKRRGAAKAKATAESPSEEISAKSAGNGGQDKGRNYFVGPKIIDIFKAMVPRPVTWFNDKDIPSQHVLYW